MERKKKSKKKIFTDRPTLFFPEQMSGNTQFIFLGLMERFAGPNNKLYGNKFNNLSKWNSVSQERPLGVMDFNIIAFVYFVCTGNWCCILID